MRHLLPAILLGVGLAVGLALPDRSQIARRALAAIGMSDKTVPAGETTIVGKSHSDADEHGRSGGERGEVRAQSEAEGEDGRVRFSAEQIANQDIAVAKVEGGIIHRHILVPGTITPDTDRIAKVPARVVGTVAEMRKRLGDAVKKGDVVAVLDSREVADAKSDYLTASVKAELEKTNYDRQQALWDKRVSAEQAYLNAKAVYSEASLRQDLARQKLSALGLNAAEVARLAKQDEASTTTSTLRQYELRAPISGRIVERKVDVGTAVGKEGDPSDVYTVADLADVWIELSVSTADLPNVKEGARVVVTPSQGDDQDKRAEGKVVFVSPILNQDTRSARVVVSLPNPDFAWRPGTFVMAEVLIADVPVAVRLPKAALQTIAGRKVVFVRTREGFEKREIETGRSDDDAVEIGAGLEPGEEIAVANTFLLKAELGKAEAEHGH